MTITRTELILCLTLTVTIVTIVAILILALFAFQAVWSRELIVWARVDQVRDQRLALVQRARQLEAKIERVVRERDELRRRIRRAQQPNTPLSSTQSSEEVQPVSPPEY